jgi:RND family efflux transporter MFP subunit
LVWCAAWLVLGACGKRAESDDETTPAVVQVRTSIALSQGFTETIGALGTVAPRAGHSASLSAPTAARVARVLVTAGQHVGAGQPLIELDPAPFQASQASAQATLDAAQQAYDRELRLSREGIVARKDVEQAAADLARARADLENSRRESQLSVLRSPIAGVVTRMSATLGASVDPSQPLVDIADPDALDVLLSMSPDAAARVRPGARVVLTAGESAGGTPLGGGTVADVSGTVDTVTRTVQVRVAATPTRPLRIGETVFGQVAVRTIPNAITVPIAALVPEGDGYKVFVVDANNVAHATPVTVGGRTATTAQITAGLTPGARVVTYGAYGVEDSAKVVQLPATATEQP